MKDSSATSPQNVNDSGVHGVMGRDRHLRETVRQYVSHYHLERNHQGLDNSLIDAIAPLPPVMRCVRRKQRLGGLLSYYHREAA